MDIKRMDPTSKAAAVKYARQAMKAESGCNRNESKVSSSDVSRQGDDRIILSQKAKDLNRIREMLMALPDMRNERINEVKTRIDKGIYRIDNRALAEKLLKEI